MKGNSRHEQRNPQRHSQRLGRCTTCEVIPPSNVDIPFVSDRAIEDEEPGTVFGVR